MTQYNVWIHLDYSAMSTKFSVLHIDHISHCFKTFLKWCPFRLDIYFIIKRSIVFSWKSSMLCPPRLARAGAGRESDTRYWENKNLSIYLFIYLINYLSGPDQGKAPWPPQQLPPPHPPWRLFRPRQHSPRTSGSPWRPSGKSPLSQGWKTLRRISTPVWGSPRDTLDRSPRWRRR